MKLEHLANAKQLADELLKVRDVLTRKHPTAPGRLQVTCSKTYTPPGASSYEDLTVVVDEDVVEQMLERKRDALVDQLRELGVNL